MYCGTITHKTSEKCPVSKVYVAGQTIGQNGGKLDKTGQTSQTQGLPNLVMRYHSENAYLSVSGFHVVSL